MSALPTSSLARIAPAHWVTAGELARRTGLSGRSIQRACKGGGDLQHCHRWRDSSEGPQFLEIDIHAPTCPERYRQQQKDAGEVGAAHALTDKQLAKAGRLAVLFEEIESLFAAGTHQRAKIEDFLNRRRADYPWVPSLSNYYRLRKSWLASGKQLAGLADGRAMAGGGVKCDVDADALAFFAGLYLQESQPHASVCYDKTVEEGQKHGWVIPSLKTVHRRLFERYAQDERIRLRQGAKAHRDQTQAFIVRDWSEMKANEFWVSDHCLLDVIGIDDLPGGNGRPRRMWLTSWMDEATRFLVSYRIHRGPNKVQVLASFFLGIVAQGLPDHIRIDNGKEYRCKMFAGGRPRGGWREEITRLEVDPEALRPLLYDLGITPHFAQPYNARAKIIEPWHRHCVKEQFSKFCPGYCGGSTEEKPEQLADLVQHWEKTGQGLWPWSKLVAMLATVFDGYHRKAHQALNGQCPAFIRQQKLQEISLRLVDERTAALFLEPREITCGTFLSIDGAHYGLGNPVLIKHQGEKLRCRLDPFNAGRVYVYNLRGDFITIAENAGRVAANATGEHLKQSQAMIGHHNKMARKFAESSAILASIDPAAAIALQSTRGAIQPVASSPMLSSYAPLSYKPDFTARADDGSRRLPALPASPAPEVSTDEQVTQRTDSAVGKKAAWVLPDNILDAFTE